MQWAAATSPEGPGSTSKALPVLLVDDQPAVRTTVTRLLAAAGFQVTAAANGLDALAHIRLCPYAAIVCDVRMEFMSGDAFFEELQAEYPDMAGRVIFITAFADEPEIRAFLDSSGRPMLEKPFHTEELVSLVQQVAQMAG